MYNAKIEVFLICTPTIYWKIVYKVCFFIENDLDGNVELGKKRFSRSYYPGSIGYLKELDKTGGKHLIELKINVMLLLPSFLWILN